MRDPDADVSRAAVEALARVGDARAVPVFERILENEDGYFAPAVREAAERALAR